jgi:hypothetical protein
VSPGFAGCQVPVSPRQRMRESGAHINDRGMVFETPRGRSGSTNKFGD